MIEKILSILLDEDKAKGIHYLFRYRKHVDFLKTIYTNFKYFPISDALKFPIVIGKNTDIKLGSIKFNCPIKPSLVRLGTQPIPVIEDGFSRLVVKNSGTIEIGGLFICQTGVKILIREGAVFSVADKVKFGHLSKVVCHKKISIGNDFRMSWECQIFDTDFHFVYNTEKNKYYPRLKPVIIGNDVFVGNRSTIGKGTILPNGSIVSCNSNVSGDFSINGDNILIKGNPAVFVKNNLIMGGNSFYPEKEEIVAQMLNE